MVPLQSPLTNKTAFFFIFLVHTTQTLSVMKTQLKIKEDKTSVFFMLKK